MSSDEAKKVDGRLETEVIATRLKAASPGEWVVGSPKPDFVIAGEESVCECFGSNGRAEANADFIAHAPADIEWLLQRIEDLHEEIQEMFEER